ncbi:MAG: extracellular solute-binding protein [Chloroflexi bacterium]|nr:extracellular solute-binding protein [Chloroflexota bacterium]
MLTLVAACASATSPAVAPAPADKGPAAPAKQSWETDWDKTLAEAKREGKVTIYTVLSNDPRRGLSAEFARKYGIELEFVLGRGEELTEKIAAERRAGLYLVDLFVGGATTPVTTHKPAGFLDPLKPLLILPEVTDPKVWYGGQLFFIDKERQYVVCPILTASNNYNSVNTDLVRAEEFTTYRDLLNPKWKGKVIMNDPSIAGAGARWFAVVADQIMGLDFIREMVKNEPVVTRDQRFQAEGLARGKFAIGIGVQTGIQAELIKAGAPIKTVIPKEGGWLGGGGGLFAYFKNAPHPNATRIFANWFLSKEGQTIYSTTAVAESARLDVPTDHLNKDDLRAAGVNYFMSEDEEFQYKMRDYQKTAREVLSPLFK